MSKVVHSVTLPVSCRVKLWASAFGGELKSISAKYSGSQLLQKVRTSYVYWQYETKFKVENPRNKFHIP